MDACGGTQRDAEFELVYGLGEDVVDSGVARVCVAAGFD